MTASLPIWREARSLGRTSTDAPRTVDVAVVGAGITGTTALHHLAHAGATAVLIEAGQPGSGSSATGSGVVGWSRSVADTTEVDPRASGYAAIAPALSGAQEWFADYVAEHGLDTGLEIPGSVHIAGPTDPGPLGTVHPGRLINALVGAAVAASGALLVDEPVRSISRHTRGFQLLTSRRKISARSVILAAGTAPAPHPLGELRRRYRLRRGRCIVAAAEPTTLNELVPEGRTTHSAASTVAVLRRIDATSVLAWFPDLGRRRQSMDPTDLVAADWPQLRDAAITHDWADPYGTPRDGLPRIGRINTLWYAGGAPDPALGALLGRDVAGLTIGTVGSSPFAEIPHEYALTGRIRARLTSRRERGAPVSG